MLHLFPYHSRNSSYFVFGMLFLYALFPLEFRVIFPPDEIIMVPLCPISLLVFGIPEMLCKIVWNPEKHHKQRFIPLWAGRCITFLEYPLIKPNTDVSKGHSLPHFKLRLRSLFVKSDWVCHVWYNI